MVVSVSVRMQLCRSSVAGWPVSIPAALRAWRLVLPTPPHQADAREAEAKQAESRGLRHGGHRREVDRHVVKPDVVEPARALEGDGGGAARGDEAHGLVVPVVEGARGRSGEGHRGAGTARGESVGPTPTVRSAEVEAERVRRPKGGRDRLCYAREGRTRLVVGEVEEELAVARGEAKRIARADPCRRVGDDGPAGDGRGARVQRHGVVALVHEAARLEASVAEEVGGRRRGGEKRCTRHKRMEPRRWVSHANLPLAAFP